VIVEYKIDLLHTEVRSMLTFRLRNSQHVRSFVIAHTRGSGWEIREEQDGEVLRLARYFDWHRVERAREAFKRQAATLQERGWMLEG
jgi:hypothetical protein